MTLSVLIPTLPKRKEQAFALLSKLESQIGEHSVELLCLYDNKVMSVGVKRTKLLHLASGEYIAFIDDDDEIADDYVSSIFGAIGKDHTDLITFNVYYSDNTGVEFLCDYSTDERRPAHIHVWKRELTEGTDFADKQTGEDVSWVKKMLPKITTKQHIPKVLYYYKYDAGRTETQR